MQAVPETPELSLPADLTGHLWVQELPTGGWLRFQVTAAGAITLGTPDATYTTVTALPAPYRRAAWQLWDAVDRDGVRTATEDPESITFVGRATWNEGLAYPWQEVPAFLGTDVWVDDGARYVPPDAAATAFDRIGVPTLPVITKERPAAHTDLERYTDPDRFPSSAWRDGRAAGVLVRDKTGTRAQAWRAAATDTAPDDGEVTGEALAAQYATQARIADAVDRVDASERTRSVETVRDRVVADVAREHYPAMHRNGDPIASMDAFESAVAERVQRHLAEQP